ncbi:heterokaryon incompatibility protein-domain-containing protein [Phyllosticta capitalensis]
MAESPPRYQYAPLEGPNSFRILELLKGEDGEPLRCNINHVSMDRRPQYEALSYVWSVGKATIYCGSSNTNATLKVSVTCLRALKALRLRDQSRSLWIDAICINQEDSPAAIAEKNQQVKMMHKIYENAFRVLVYPMGLHKLSREDVGTLLGLLNLERDQLHQEKIPIPQEYQDMARLVDKDFGIFQIHGIALRMDWFFRTWVIQEAALAEEATMILEKAEAPFYELLDLSLKIYEKRNRSQDDELRSQLFLHASLHNRSTPRPSLQLAHIARGAKATRPVDKLYALIGIASDRDHFQNAISYGKNVATVFADFSQRFINQSRNLDLLSVVRESPPSEVLPSWAVQWDTMNVNYCTVLDPFGSRKNFIACGDFASTEMQGQNTQELHLRGIKIDSVATRSIRASEDSVQKLAAKARSLFPCLEEKICRMSGQSPESQAQTCVIYNDIEKAIMNTLSCGAVRMDEQVVKASANPMFESDEHSFYGFGREVWTEVIHHAKYYAFINTSSGYMGLVDKLASKGGIICILSGGSVPYVLRPVPGEEGKYQFISEAYIKGVMHGEAMEGNEEKDLQDFILV